MKKGQKKKLEKAKPEEVKLVKREIPKITVS